MTLKFAHQPVAAEESVRAALTKELRLEEPFFREQRGNVELRIPR